MPKTKPSSSPVPDAIRPSYEKLTFDLLPHTPAGDFARRLRQAMDYQHMETRGRQSWMAELLAVSGPTAHGWYHGIHMPDETKTMILAHQLDVSYDWLRFDKHVPRESDKNVRERPEGYLRALNIWNNPSDLPDDQYVMLPKLDYYLSAGNGGPDPNAVDKSESGAAFRADFAAQNKWSSKTHYSMRAKGDSMEPTVQNGAPVVIATNEKTIKSGKIYAILIDGEPLLKRLDKLPGGLIRVRSDNTANLAYSSYEISESDIEIIGRAVWTPVML